MATPTLRALREHLGSTSKLIGIQRPYVREVLGGTNFLDESIEYAPKSRKRSSHCFAVIRQLRDAKLDAAVLLPNSARSALMAWAAGIPERIGYVRYGRGRLLTQKLHPPREGRTLMPISAVDYYLKLAELTGARIQHPKLELGTQPIHENAADEIWKRNRLDGEEVIAINTGGAYGAAKSWPEEHFAETAVKIAKKRDVRFMVVCGPEERAAARRIQTLATNVEICSLADESLSIGLTKAIIRRCRMLITTDSGPRFFGIAFGVPTVTIFGPTDPRWSEPHDPLSVNVRKDVPCGPCAKRVCPLSHHSCMRDLTPEFRRFVRHEPLGANRKEASRLMIATLAPAATMSSWDETVPKPWQMTEWQIAA